ELLLWMSARGAGSFDSFKMRASAIDVRARSRVFASYRIAQWNLSVLGHAEFLDMAAGPGWRVAPPVISADDYQSPDRAVLCGARTTALLNRLSAAFGDSRLRATQQDAGPDLIEIIGCSAPLLAALATQARISLQWNAALSLLSVAEPPKAAQLKAT